MIDWLSKKKWMIIGLLVTVIIIALVWKLIIVVVFIALGYWIWNSLFRKNDTEQ